MQEKNELISYAMDFASYLVFKIKEINRIILHGSIVRGDYDEKSDVDLFVDTSALKLEKKISRTLEDYYKTKKFKEWKLKGVVNKISIIAGSLDSTEWKDLKRAIMNTGIILYGKYKSDMEKINQYTLFSFENIKPDKKRIAVFRRLFGFKAGKKEYKGLVDKIDAVRIGKGCILVSVDHVNELKRFFQDKNIKVRLYDFWSDVKIV